MNKYTPMTVGELISQLQLQDADSEVSICGFAYDACVSSESLLVEKKGSQVIIFGNKGESSVAVP